MGSYKKSDVDSLHSRLHLKQTKKEEDGFRLQGKCSKVFNESAFQSQQYFQQ